MKILCIRLSALGDVVLTTGVIRQISLAYPQAEIHFLTDTSLAPVLALCPEIRTVHTLDRKKALKNHRKFVKNLPPFDIVLDWHDSIRSQKFCNDLSCPQTAVIKKQSLQRRVFVATKLGNNKLRKHVVEKYYEAAKKVLSLPDLDREQLRPSLLAPNLSDSLAQEISIGEPYTVVHPYASQENKVWPFFDSLIQELRLKKQRVFVVGREENAVADHPDNLSNRTSLEDTLALISNAQGLISTDSGPMHFGLASKTPTLGLFGPTTREFGFFPDFSGGMAVEAKGLDCRPCHVHGGSSCPQGHFQCMKSLTVEQLISSYFSLIQ